MEDFFKDNQYKFNEIDNDSFGGIAIYYKDVIIEVNKQFENILGYECGELKNRDLREIFTLDSYLIAIKNSVYGYERTSLLNCIKKDKELIKCKVCNKLTNYNEKSVGILTIRKIEDEQEHLSESDKERTRYKFLFENFFDGIYICTLEGKFIDVNSSLIKILGYKSKDELIKAKVPKELFIYSNIKSLFINNSQMVEVELKKQNNESIYAEVSFSIIYENTKPAYVQGVIRDITQRKMAEKQIWHMSFHDGLTSLYNRAFFEEELKRLDDNRHLPLSLIIGDLNGLKLINDTFGHHEGDLLLCNCSNIFRKCCRSSDIISRWGGDEFAIILPETTEKNTEEIIRRIREEQNKDTGSKIITSIAIGYSTKNNIEQDIKDIIKEAEDNMYTNKLIESKSTSSAIVTSLKKTLYEKSIETEAHAERLENFALKIGKKIGLSSRKLDELVLLGSLHDIGKVATPEEILKKPGLLTENEWEEIRKHPETGYRITLSSFQLSIVSKGILYHHERWDGKGYPEGLMGEDIPIISRVISIVDAYDVMRNGRPYKKKISKKNAIKELQLHSGKQFDPDLVNIFIQILREEDDLY